MVSVVLFRVRVRVSFFGLLRWVWGVGAGLGWAFACNWGSSYGHILFFFFKEHNSF